MNLKSPYVVAPIVSTLLVLSVTGATLALAEHTGPTEEDENEYEYNRKGVMYVPDYSEDTLYIRVSEEMLEERMERNVPSITIRIHSKQAPIAPQQYETETLSETDVEFTDGTAEYTTQTLNGRNAVYVFVRGDRGEQRILSYYVWPNEENQP